VADLVAVAGTVRTQICQFSSDVASSVDIVIQQQLQPDWNLVVVLLCQHYVAILVAALFDTAGNIVTVLLWQHSVVVVVVVSGPSNVA